MKIFFDTEFTDLIPIPSLISAGFVAENGGEFYAELTDTYAKDDCSPFVIDAVLPLLDGCKWQMTEWDFAFALQAWIESLGTDVLLYSDSPGYDCGLVKNVFNKYHCWPANLRVRKCDDFLFLGREAEFLEEEIESYWIDKEHLRHHALEDARCLMFAWKKIMGRVGVIT
jgi:hypothetical protein